MASNAEVLEKVGEVAVSIARIEQKMIRFDEISLELTKAIKGNGKPGLDDRVRVIENCIEHDKEKKAEIKEVKTKWDGRMWALAASVLLLVAKDVIQLIFK